MCVCMCVHSMAVCVCVFVCVEGHIDGHTMTHLKLHVHVCVPYKQLKVFCVHVIKCNTHTGPHAHIHEQTHIKDEAINLCSTFVLFFN